ncbi:kinesin-like protein KIF13B isoform 1-T1 [Salvelinus alpinus]
MKMSDTKVKVAVRVRPMNRRETELHTKCVVDMEDNQTVLHPPPSNNKGENSRERLKLCPSRHQLFPANLMDIKTMLSFYFLSLLDWTLLGLCY